ncbi:ChaN family lipoprotein [Thalassococcus lentus]|uniref:ChaN family lipoprotein n=1 Tax=Thalassococcus lentus TaxID=1210524 RepID=A0ABT4XWD8_9RHOB|nr:ChaN family lipoprotein [Thalassococcus lentus]MDA7426291.1 ChaN family lipoprotein [Thalassococcus lentus]
MKYVALAALLIAPTVHAEQVAFDADVLFLGEQHDNPAHHERQAEIVSEVGPAALVFEMLTAEQAARVTPELIADKDQLEAALGWSESGWPDFSMYHPIFAAAPDAAYFGAAVPRREARRVMSESVTAIFGDEAGLYGLTEPLPADQQEEREALQLAAHCDAMPQEMLPVMVDIQRLRDAFLARAAVEAREKTGGSVIVITGNGHARTDWGAPVALSRVAPELSIAALGQGELAHGAPTGTFDMIEIASDVERDDPCAAFK